MQLTDASRDELKQLEEHANKMKATNVPLPEPLRKRGNAGFKDWEDVEKYARVTRAMLELCPKATIAILAGR